MCTLLLTHMLYCARLCVTLEGYIGADMKKKLLYIALAEKIMQDILSGKLEAGSKVLSVRDMALAEKVNPKTVQKAFEYLEQRNIFESRHGEGRFVTNDKRKLQSIKAILLEEEIDNFIGIISKIDISNQEILEILENKLNGQKEKL